LDSYKTYSDEQLIDLIANDNREAYTAFYSRYYQRIFQYLTIALRSKHDAEEILQDIFLRLWVKRSALRGIVSIENYLFRMARNRLIDFVRSNKQKRNEQLLLLSENEMVTHSVTEDLLLKEYHSAAQKAIHSLPERRRVIFLLNAQEELSAVEIAAKLGTTVAVVRKQLYKASHFIREYLQQHIDVVAFLGIGCYLNFF
jgi:RNA polymerase sigma-70 factor (family 1)